MFNDIENHIGAGLGHDGDNNNNGAKYINWGGAMIRVMKGRGWGQWGQGQVWGDGDEGRKPTALG